MKTNLTLSLLLMGSAAAMAQTTPKAPVKRTPSATPHAATTPAHAVGGCATGIPAISPKIPALPASAGCPKALYTVSRRPDVTMDYISPLVGPEVRAEMDFAPTTFSLAYVDSIPGTGPLVKFGQFLTVKYTGWTVAGDKFDSSDDHPGAEPLVLPYGSHKVIQGWDTGFEGMHVGGKRRLFIPYQLAYGDAGHPPAIPPKSWLVFDVELVSASATAPEPKAPPAPPAPPAGAPQPAAGTPAQPAKPAAPQK